MLSLLWRVLAGFSLLLATLALEPCVVQAQTSRPTISEDRTKLYLNGRLLLENEKDGFMSIKDVKHSPNKKRFLVIACGYECSDNIGFVFTADGVGKRKFTARWDFIQNDQAEWAGDSRSIVYYRINSTGADPPRNAPRTGWVRYSVITGRKRYVHTMRRRVSSSNSGKSQA